MTDENYDTEPSGDSRRSFMKKGAIAASAVALGAGASASTAAAQDTSDALVFAYDYFPSADFEVLAELQQSTTIDVLQVDDDTVDEISSPDEWDGYVIRYDVAGESAGVTTFLFTRDNGLSSDDTGTLGEDASMFSSELNLLQTSVESDGDTGDDEDDDLEDDEDDDLEDDEDDDLEDDTTDDDDDSTLEEDDVTVEDNDDTSNGNETSE